MFVPLRDHHLPVVLLLVGTVIAHVYAAIVCPENLDLAGAVRHGEPSPLGESRHVPVGLQEDPQALHDRHLVSLVPRHRPSLEHVVLRTAHERQLTEQTRERRRAVIHAAHYRALIHRLRTGLAQQPNRLACLRGELPRVIEVVHDVDLRLGVALLLDQPQEIRIVEDPVRVERGHLGADPDDPHVRHCRYVTDDRLQPARGHDEGIATREEHVGDLLVFGDVLEARLVSQSRVVVVVHEQPLAEAVAAIRTTHLVDQE